ncbi:BTAD domain-containing putative transcriptional regulator [Micromonospora sp. WMMD1082]|uniref:AfsR/SARP family transcriptional regulator n=1 Tax=Micromonospora sp. WMMD1082 TaxID=3016104 RepID=UPI002415A4A0|nr:BTAD domain-containing putative transcriptional regulator [Micromonospora sp. WMMD1082]MDG4798268.1 BTAD domain-containing putative transcriptional regulator [Micromonospora sp. WMMD1082]
MKQRLLLAALLLRANDTVGTSELASVLWADQPPPSAAANLRTYVRGLRQLLGGDDRGDRIPAAAGGYLLRVGPDERDLDRFDAAAARGREALAAGDAVRAEVELGGAVELWRGMPLADLPLPPVLARRVAPLQERRLLAEEDYAEAMLQLGAVVEVVHRLRVLLDEHPLRQRAWGQLMLGLYRIGDVAGALDAFRQARQILAEETGLDPAPHLTRLHDDILHHRPGLLTTPPAGPTEPEPGPAAVADLPAPAGPRPEQLPLAVPEFVGRAAELARLDALVDTGGSVPATVIISAVSGMAGVGKTTLALHWAHRVAGRFPDGQLYVNLHGYDEADVVFPDDALQGFLEALGVPQARIPASTEARTGLYRSLLASRRMLVVLDNARDAAQVRPLLPGAGGCLVVVTSRDRLAELVAAECAEPLRLDVLSDSESMSLLVGRLGALRLAAEPDAVTDIIAATGRLPLALSMVAARVATHPAFPLDAFAAELHSADARLDALADGDVRRVFSRSYLALSPAAARLFRLLGLHPGPDLTADAAAALAGVSAAAVRPPLRELTRLHLLTEHAPGRYSFHDLLRVYAAELADSSEHAEDRRAGRRRLYDHYLHSAYPAALLLQPQWAPIDPVPPLPTAARRPVTDHDTALAWFTAEHRVLLRVVRQAAECGFEAYAWQIAWASNTFVAPRGLWQDQLSVQQIALAAAEKIDDIAGQATANRLLSRAFTRLGEHEDAEYRLRRALELYERLNDPTGQAQTLHNYCELCYLLGRPDEALAQAREALRLYRLAGNRSGAARTLNAIGWLLATAGEYAQAIASCTEALAEQRRSGDRNGQAATLDSIGFAYDRLGEYARAVDCYEEAIQLFRDSADRYHEAETLLRLGDTRETMGEPAAAVAAWRQAAQIYDEVGDPAIEDARRRLDRSAESTADRAG